LEKGAENEIESGKTSLSMLNKTLRWISYILLTLALAASLALLIGDAKPGLLATIPAAVISAAPLLLVGMSVLILQPIIRPRFLELLKNALLAATFLLWGIIQLMPRNNTSIRLGNVVIVLYVLDLSWAILASNISQKRN
jgi:hypothetical protein